MKISTLIRQLEKVKSKRGNLPVDACGWFGDPFDVDFVAVETETIYQKGKEKQRTIVRLYSAK
jgi:hypothetical protein